MAENDFAPKELALQLEALAIFRSLLDAPVVQKFHQALRAAQESDAQRVSAYSAFVAALYEDGGNFGESLLRLVLNSENAVVKLRAKKENETPEMASCLAQELALFTRLVALNPAQVAEAFAAEIPLPVYASTPCDFAQVYAERLQEAPTKGYGMFATHHMFSLQAGGRLRPVKNPDPQQLCELAGYEREREQVVLNTRALLQGLPANNVLLYGDAGTGKSSTVKAVANAFAGEGLRLIEIHKSQLYEIPMLMDTLADTPLKFILFIDDLSFTSEDADFTVLKAILEGNISARPQNIVVYATSNRRHMVKEHFADRQGSEVHTADTVEEETSLSARFGITITFLRPGRDVYASIVKALAAEYGLQTPEEELLVKAEAHAIRYGGRSPRVARQFAEHMKALEMLP